MIDIREPSDDGALLRVTLAELLLLHGALRDGMNDIPEPTALADDPRRAGELLLALGDVLWWTADPPERKGRGRRRVEDWYWSQWITPRPRPARLAEATLDVRLTWPELDILRRVTPLALAAVGPEAWETRVGCTAERSRELHDELVAALERAGR